MCACVHARAYTMYGVRWKLWEALGEGGGGKYVRGHGITSHFRACVRVGACV